MKAIKYKGKLYTPLYGANSIEGEIEDVDAKLEAELERLKLPLAVTEEILRRADGYIHVGHGCELAIRGTSAKLEKAVGVLKEIAKARLERKPTSEDSMGNYDDVFSDGISLGEHYQAEIASEALASIEPKEGA